MRFLSAYMTVSVSYCCLLICPCVVKAADPPKPGAILATDLSQVDDDFRFQGEYMGYVSQQAASRLVKKVGLQLIARGDGKFDAVLYQGGLPGDGWDQQNREQATGHKNDGVVMLQFEQTQVTVAKNSARFSGVHGQTLGIISKYARTSSTAGLNPPRDAIVLFNGQKNELWKDMKVTEGKLLEQGCETVESFNDFRLHLEFRLPYKPATIGQDRGNSGVYLQRRYEVQVLDSFGLEGLPNQCGGIYKLHAPQQNMCITPLSWQTYDIDFRMARFDDVGKKTENMRIRVRHNGIVIHNGIEVASKTGAGKPETSAAMPILLQDHGNPVRYRNIWLVKGDPFVTPAYSTGKIQSQPRSAFRYENQIYPTNTTCPNCQNNQFYLNGF